MACPRPIFMMKSTKVDLFSIEARKRMRRARFVFEGLSRE